MIRGVCLPGLIYVVSHEQADRASVATLHGHRRGPQSVIDDAGKSRYLSNPLLMPRTSKFGLRSAPGALRHRSWRASCFT